MHTPKGTTRRCATAGKVNMVNSIESPLPFHQMTRSASASPARHRKDRSQQPQRHPAELFAGGRDQLLRPWQHRRQQQQRRLRASWHSSYTNNSYCHSGIDDEVCGGQQQQQRCSGAMPAQRHNRQPTTGENMLFEERRLRPFRRHKPVPSSSSSDCEATSSEASGYLSPACSDSLIMQQQQVWDSACYKTPAAHSAPGKLKQQRGHDGVYHPSLQQQQQELDKASCVSPAIHSAPGNLKQQMGPDRVYHPSQQQEQWAPACYMSPAVYNAPGKLRQQMGLDRMYHPSLQQQQQLKWDEACYRLPALHSAPGKLRQHFDCDRLYCNLQQQGYSSSRPWLSQVLLSAPDSRACDWSAATAARADATAAAAANTYSGVTFAVLPRHRAGRRAAVTAAVCSAPVPAAGRDSPVVAAATTAFRQDHKDCTAVDPPANPLLSQSPQQQQQQQQLGDAESPRPTCPPTSHQDCQQQQQQCEDDLQQQLLQQQCDNLQLQLALEALNLKNEDLQDRLAAAAAAAAAAAQSELLLQQCVQRQQQQREQQQQCDQSQQQQQQCGQRQQQRDQQQFVLDCIAAREAAVMEAVEQLKQDKQEFEQHREQSQAELGQQRRHIKAIMKQLKHREKQLTALQSQQQQHAATEAVAAPQQQQTCRSLSVSGLLATVNISCAVKHYDGAVAYRSHSSTIQVCLGSSLTPAGQASSASRAATVYKRSSSASAAAAAAVSTGSGRRPNLPASLLVASAGGGHGLQGSNLSVAAAAAAVNEVTPAKLVWTLKPHPPTAAAFPRPGRTIRPASASQIAAAAAAAASSGTSSSSMTASKSRSCNKLGSNCTRAAVGYVACDVEAAQHNQADAAGAVTAGVAAATFDTGKLAAADAYVALSPLSRAGDVTTTSSSSSSSQSDVLIAEESFCWESESSAAPASPSVDARATAAEHTFAEPITAAVADLISVPAASVTSTVDVTPTTAAPAPVTAGQQFSPSDAITNEDQQQQQHLLLVDHVSDVPDHAVCVPSSAGSAVAAADRHSPELSAAVGLPDQQRQQKDVSMVPCHAVCDHSPLTSAAAAADPRLKQLVLAIDHPDQQQQQQQDVSDAPGLDPEGPATTTAAAGAEAMLLAAQRCQALAKMSLLCGHLQTQLAALLASRDECVMAAAAAAEVEADLVGLPEAQPLSAAAVRGGSSLRAEAMPCISASPVQPPPAAAGTCEVAGADTIAAAAGQSATNPEAAATAATLPAAEVVSGQLLLQHIDVEVDAAHNRDSNSTVTPRVVDALPGLKGDYIDEELRCASSKASDSAGSALPACSSHHDNLAHTFGHTAQQHSDSATAVGSQNKQEASTAQQCTLQQQQQQRLWVQGLGTEEVSTAAVQQPPVGAEPVVVDDRSKHGSMISQEQQQSECSSANGTQDQQEAMHEAFTTQRHALQQQQNAWEQGSKEVSRSPVGPEPLLVNEFSTPVVGGSQQQQRVSEQGLCTEELSKAAVGPGSVAVDEFSTPAFGSSQQQKGMHDASLSEQQEVEEGLQDTEVSLATLVCQPQHSSSLEQQHSDWNLKAVCRMPAADYEFHGSPAMVSVGGLQQQQRQQQCDGQSGQQQQQVEDLWACRSALVSTGGESETQSSEGELEQQQQQGLQHPDPGLCAEKSALNLAVCDSFTLPPLTELQLSSTDPMQQQRQQQSALELDALSHSNFHAQPEDVDSSNLVNQQQQQCLDLQVDTETSDDQELQQESVLLLTPVLEAPSSPDHPTPGVSRSQPMYGHHGGHATLLRSASAEGLTAEALPALIDTAAAAGQAASDQHVIVLPPTPESLQKLEQQQQSEEQHQQQGMEFPCISWHTSRRSSSDGSTYFYSVHTATSDVASMYSAVWEGLASEGSLSGVASAAALVTARSAPTTPAKVRSVEYPADLDGSEVQVRISVNAGCRGSKKSESGGLVSPAGVLFVPRVNVIGTELQVVQQQVGGL